jgi:UDP-N-acetylglucosamine 2-epimerase (non-hydrolysing)/UDP-GlcNAc3NAcA epimerase
LAAVKLGIPVAHVEAGLRSFDMTMPEEINRRIVDHISDLHLCPTPVAVDNLAREGIAGDNVVLTGDVMADIALAIAPAADRRWPAVRKQLGLEIDGSYAVATIHRAANTTADALAKIIELLAAVPMPVLLPLHPRTAAMLERFGLHVALTDLPNVHLVPPLGYLDLAGAVRDAAVVLTDSGGLQKEAYLHGTPCLTLRPSTEWTETVEAGMNVLVNLDRQATVEQIEEIDSGAWVDRIERRPALYGNGDAAHRTLDALHRFREGGSAARAREVNAENG